MTKRESYYDYSGELWIFTGRRCKSGHKIFEGDKTQFCGCENDGPDDY